jgi:hypothetical protein
MVDGGAGGARPDGGGGAGGSGFGGFGGSGFGGFGGFVVPDGGAMHCPTERPVDSSPCSMRVTCRYPDAVCNCVRFEGQDGGEREWNCFDTMPPRDSGAPRDAAMCPRDAPHEGDMCMNPGLRCAGGNQGTVCTCEAGDGNLEWHC